MRSSVGRMMMIFMGGERRLSLFSFPPPFFGWGLLGFPLPFPPFEGGNVAWWLGWASGSFSSWGSWVVSFR